jgi:hypothetical protein
MGGNHGIFDVEQVKFRISMFRLTKKRVRNGWTVENVQTKLNPPTSFMNCESPFIAG